MKDPKSIKGLPVAPISQAGDYFPDQRENELHRLISFIRLKNGEIVTISFYCRSEWDGLSYIEDYVNNNFPNQWREHIAENV